jgi:hypothetical protein
VPPHNWQVDPSKAIQQFEARHHNPDAGARFMWAVSAVDSLHYLDDLDRAFDKSYMPIAGHHPDVIDIAHARWATGTSITALDLCAAGLGRAFCGQRGTYELDIENIKGRCKTRLPKDAQKWIDSVLADLQYSQVAEARRYLTHSRVPRHLFEGGPPKRLSLQLGSAQLSVRDLIEYARDVATRHVSDFLQILPQL